MEYLQPVYSCSAVSVTLLAVILLAATIKRRSWLMGYISAIIIVMSVDKATSLWSIGTMISDGIVFRQAVIARLIAKEVLYSVAFMSFFIYLLSDYVPSKFRGITKLFLKGLSDQAEKW